MTNPDRLSSGFFILLSVTICLFALQLPGGTLKNPGPMVFPFLLGLCLLILSVAFFVQSRGSRTSSDSRMVTKGEILKVAYLLGVFSFSIMILEPLGFEISLFVLLALLIKGIGRRTLVRSIFYGMIISLPTYFLFTRILGVRLPRGVFFF